MPGIDPLLRNPLFAGANPERLRAELSRTPVRERTFLANRVVAVQGEPLDSLVFLVEGRLAASIESPAGKSLLVETLEAPDVLAPAVLYSPEPAMPVTLTALSPGRTISIARNQVERLGNAFPSIYIHLLREVGEKFSFLATRMRLLHFATLRQKIAGYLLEREKFAGGDTITLPYGRDRLAELFGVARPSLSRALGEMAREGLLSIQRNEVRVEDLAALIRASEDGQ